MWACIPDLYHNGMRGSVFAAVAASGALLSTLVTTAEDVMATWLCKSELEMLWCQAVT
jgi:hypothetical protein